MKSDAQLIQQFMTEKVCCQLVAYLFPLNCVYVYVWYMYFVVIVLHPQSLEPYNTRVFKTADKNGKTVYELRLASALTSCKCGILRLLDSTITQCSSPVCAYHTGEPCGDTDTLAAILGEHVFNDTIVNVTRGDYAPLMSAVVENLSKAKVSGGTVYKIFFRFLPPLCVKIGASFCLFSCRVLPLMRTRS